MANIQGLYPKSNQTKVPFLEELTVEEDPMVIALTETHLHNGIKDEEIAICNYTPYRTDRHNRSHGGAMLYVRNNIALTTTQLLSYSNGQVEIIAVHLKQLNMVIINCYRPPQCGLQEFRSAVENINKVIDNLPPPMPEIILCGDFNFPLISWPSGSVSGGTLEHQVQAKLLLETTEKNFLTQQITQPTRQHNTLDLFFTNNQEAISKYRVEKSSLSDHNLITINTTYLKSKSLSRFQCNKSFPF